MVKRFHLHSFTVNRLHPKIGNNNCLFIGRRLFQEYCIIQYIEIENMRLQWIQNNQKAIIIKAELYGNRMTSQYSILLLKNLCSIKLPMSAVRFRLFF